MIRSQSMYSYEELKPDLTPLLDIIFIVMVFLLLTANIHIQTMKVAIPTTQDSEVLNSPNKPVIAVNILFEKPFWAINNNQYHSWDEFSEALLLLHKQKPKQSIIIGADKNSPVEKTLQLLAFLQRNNINATRIIMDDQK